MMQPLSRLDQSFFVRDALTVAPELLGKYLVRSDGVESRAFMITEVEAYLGETDLACHASKGRTRRTEIMYHLGGCLYVYLIYGMYRMLNIVTGPVNSPQALLIRGIEGFNGPGRLTRELCIDASFNGECLDTSERIWLADSAFNPKYNTSPRIGIDYAGEPWVSKPWRYFIKD